MKIDPSIKLYPLISELIDMPEILSWAGDKSFEEIYNTCPHVKWLIILYIVTKYDYRKYLLIGALCINESRHKIKEPKSIAALDAALAYGRGEIDEIPREVLEESGQVRGDDAGYATHNIIYGALGMNNSYRVMAAVDNAVSLSGMSDSMKFTDIFRQHVKLEHFLA